jgi:hypothetical protein
MVSHSDLSKLAAESEPPSDMGATRAHSTSIFVFFDLPHEASLNIVFHHRGFFDEAVCE